MVMSPFQWGANGQQLTPDQVERLRANATLSSRRGSDASPVGHWSQGLARLIDAYGGYKGNMRADGQETAGLASADAAVQGNPVLSALMGGEQMQAPAAQPGMAAPVAPVGGGLPASIVQTESGGNWNALNSEGYGGRGQFGEARLADAARAGIIPAGMTGAQYSQAPEQTQLAVENWHRNDILKALGGYVGKDVDGAGPIPPLTEDSLLAVAHLGGTGGAKRFVESGGQYNPSDSNGTSLADYAIRHAGGTGAGAVPAGMASSMPQAPSGVVAALASASSNPWVAEKYGPVINALMQQEMGRQDASYQQTLAQSDPMYQAQLQGAQIANQQALNPVAKSQPLVNAGDGRIYDPNLGEWITAPDMGQDVPDSFRGLQLRAEAAGLTPGTPEYANFMVQGGRDTGMAIDVDPSTGAVSLRQGAGAGSMGKPFTEGQSKDNVYVTRAEGALSVLDPIAGNLTSRAGRAAESVPFGLARGAQSDDFQVAKNAGDEFLQAILRKDTGAAITEPEQALYGVTYLPQPGDSEAVLQQKTQARRRAVEAIKSGQSPAQLVAVEKALQASGSQSLAPVDAVAPPADAASPAGIPDGVPADLWAIMTPEEKAAWQ